MFFYIKYGYFNIFAIKDVGNYIFIYFINSYMKRFYYL